MCLEAAQQGSRRLVETIVARCDRMRGRRISRDTILRLVAASGGHCASPFCTTGFLWHELSDGSAVRLGEVAHIVAARVDGPRGNSESTEPALVAFANLILLCPVCHTIVDRAPDEHPIETLQTWKANHEARLLDLFGVARYETRHQARTQLVRLLEDNRVVWTRYGPESVDAWKPEVAAMWLREVKDSILPNNARIRKLLEVNSHLLRPDEQKIAGELSAHARALELRHLAGVVNPAAPRFPPELDTVFSD